MVEVVVDSVRVSLMSPQRVIVLRQVDAERYLPIWIGPYEAEAITVALQEIEMIRPLTHDLLKNVFAEFNARLVRVEIVALREDIFYGNIVAEVDGKTLNIDSRPSDAIALAVRAHIPILVDSAVMAIAGIVPEKDIRQEEEETTPASTPPAEEGSEDRLSIFEDFIEKLDIENLDEDEDQDDKDTPKKT
ncbi:MAG: bifunctional nuclease family protein [Anaerolineae bacterium]|nr:MAG: bifunctional nuclease family protein [Anaerolineae bacterium]